MGCTDLVVLHRASKRPLDLDYANGEVGVVVSASKYHCSVFQGLRSFLYLKNFGQPLHHSCTYD